MILPLLVPLPTSTGPLPVTADSYPFSTAARCRVPVDLASHGYVEEEFLLTGTARLFSEATEASPVAPTGETRAYTTRVIVRRPAESHGSATAWVSVLNASQGYDIEDDWRRAWDVIIGRGDIYVGVTAKPINADALQVFDPERYADVTWGGPLPHLRAEPGWNPFQVIEGSEEGLAWEILAQTARWLRSGDDLARPAELVMTGQSQSGIYTNTYLTHFHDLLRGPAGEALYDGYLPGVASILTRSVGQSTARHTDDGQSDDGQSDDDAPLDFLIEELAQIDVPVIAISTDGDSRLFSDGSRSDAEVFRTADGPLRRHWHVAGAPRSDARSRVIPADAEIVRCGRLPREIDDAFLASLNVLPLEPVTSAAMTAIVNWIRAGEPAAPSVWFTVDPSDPQHLAEDADGGRLGGIRLGLLEHPLAVFHGAAPGNGVLGSLELLERGDVLTRYRSFEEYRAACDAVDDILEDAGYLEPHGRELLHAVERELWDRVNDDAAPLIATPQDPDSAPRPAVSSR